MYKFENVLMRQTWRNVNTCFNRRLLVTTPVSSARALETCRLDNRVCSSQGNKSRFLSASVEAEDLNPFSLIGDDIKDVYNENIGMLRKYIRNTDMYNIATNNYHTLGDTAGLSASIFILLTKIINYHMFQDATLTEPQRKLIAIVDLFFIHAILHDDILDNANTRLGLPTAHKLWSPYKVVVTSNMLLGVAFGEASKFPNDVNFSIFQMHEVVQKGQFMHFQDVIDGDIFGHYLTTHDYKNGSTFRYVSTATARAIGAKESLVDIMARLGFNLGMTFGMVDDIGDFEEDLKNGRNSAPVIFASKEYPELKELILRRFTEEGDVEKTIELVNKSQGFEEARTLARMYYGCTMNNLRLLADSPYKRSLETMMQLFMIKIQPGAGENLIVDI